MGTLAATLLANRVLARKPLPTVAPQQPVAAVTNTIARDAFYSACAILMNIDCYELEETGIIRRGDKSGTCWKRFNDEPLLFLAKLDDDKREALWLLIQKRQPARYRV